MTLINSLKNNSSLHKNPFDHWEINSPLNEKAIKEICEADIANPIKDNLQYDGTKQLMR